ncbi:MAG: ABC transporter permease [Bacteroidales bacterium]|nr:ABC transporter permease [Bacteroidales bacterium]
MFKNYIITAIRNIRRDLFYSGINIIGLAIGMSCSILIMLWVYDELSFDKFHKDSEDIYRIIAKLPSMEAAVGPLPLAQALKDEYPEIIASCNLRGGNVLLKVDDRSYNNIKGIYSTKEFFDIFTFKILKKQKDSLLTDLNEIILTQETAEKLFGEKDPLGETINLNLDHDYIVSGIIQNTPTNSHFSFDFLINYKSIQSIKDSENVWGSFSCYPFIKIASEAIPDTVANKIENYFTKIFGEDGNKIKLGIQPITEVHLRSSHLTELYAKLGDIKYVLIFAIVSIFILIIACINFMNLSTAKATKRLTDVGIRKVVGARRSQLITQYLGESLFIAFIALLFALLFVDFMLPAFNSISQKEITMKVFTYKEIGWLITITILTGLFSGSYTALYLSKIKSAQILSKEPIHGKKGRIFRQILVITQFSISISLIIFSFVVKSQMNFIQNKDLGYKIDNLITIDLGGDIANDYTNIKSVLLEIPDVLNVTSASSLPIQIIEGTYGGNWPGKDPDELYLTNFCEVDNDFIPAIGLEIIEGRNFSEIFEVDTASYIINESAAKQMGLENPLGTEITFVRGSCKVIGVIKDFHSQSIHSAISPLILYRGKSSGNLILNVKDGNLKATIDKIRNKINENFPNYSLSYRTLTDRYNELYTNDKRVGQIFNYFAILAILLSCLGLFGLSAYSAEQRTKEIGIRKAMGSSISGIIFILEKDFIKWVLISNIIAWPVSYYFANKWLESFTYKVDISVYIFALATTLTFVIAIITVFAQAYRAAIKNPTESLRYE